MYFILLCIQWTVPRGECCAWLRFRCCSAAEEGIWYSSNKSVCLARLGWSFEILMQTETCGGFHSVWFTTESKVKCKRSTSACVCVFSAQEKTPKNVFFLGQPPIVLVAVLWSVFFVLVYDFSLFYFTSLWFHCACITSVRFWLLTADFLLCLVLEVSPHFCLIAFTCFLLPHPFLIHT